MRPGHDKNGKEMVMVNVTRSVAEDQIREAAVRADARCTRGAVVREVLAKKNSCNRIFAGREKKKCKMRRKTQKSKKEIAGGRLTKASCAISNERRVACSCSGRDTVRVLTATRRVFELAASHRFINHRKAAAGSTRLASLLRDSNYLPIRKEATRATRTCRAKGSTSAALVCFQ